VNQKENYNLNLFSKISNLFLPLVAEFLLKLFTFSADFQFCLTCPNIGQLCAHVIIYYIICHYIIIARVEILSDFLICLWSQEAAYMLYHTHMQSGTRIRYIEVRSSSYNVFAANTQCKRHRLNYWLILGSRYHQINQLAHWLTSLKNNVNISNNLAYSLPSVPHYNFFRKSLLQILVSNEEKKDYTFEQCRLLLLMQNKEGIKSQVEINK